MFSLHHRVRTSLGFHPASCRMVTGTLFPGMKWPGRKADHSSPSNAEVKNAFPWRYA